MVSVLCNVPLFFWCVRWCLLMCRIWYKGEKRICFFLNFFLIFCKGKHNDRKAFNQQITSFYWKRSYFHWTMMRKHRFWVNTRKVNKLAKTLIIHSFSAQSLDQKCLLNVKKYRQFVINDISNDCNAYIRTKIIIKEKSGELHQFSWFGNIQISSDNRKKENIV